MSSSFHNFQYQKIYKSPANLPHTVLLNNQTRLYRTMLGLLYSLNNCFCNLIFIVPRLITKIRIGIKVFPETVIAFGM